MCAEGTLISTFSLVDQFFQSKWFNFKQDAITINLFSGNFRWDIKALRWIIDQFQVSTEDFATSYIRIKILLHNSETALFKVGLCHRNPVVFGRTRQRKHPLIASTLQLITINAFKHYIFREFSCLNFENTSMNKPMVV